MLFEEKSSILIIEDNPIIQDSLKKLLTLEKYNIDVANNGEEGLECAKSKHFDLIFCDLLMPKMDGFKFCEYIKNPLHDLDTPVIILTSLNDKEELNKVRELGVDEVIVKPYDPSELVSITKNKIAKINHIKHAIERNLENNKKRILHTLSHEFKTPLMAIKTTSELLLERQSHFNKEKIECLLNSIQQGSERLEKLISDFLILQQIEIGIPKREAEKKATTFKLNTFIDNTISELKEKIQNELYGKIQVIDCSCNANIFVYDIQLQDAIKRIIENSIKFSPEKPDIEIFLLKENEKIVIEICDKGIGIKENKTKDAIKLFSQIDRESIEQQGSGSGLFIASEFVKANNGSFEIHPREPLGTTVQIHLPIV